jgi:hypothetical protein
MQSNVSDGSMFSDTPVKLVSFRTLLPACVPQLRLFLCSAAAPAHPPVLSCGLGVARPALFAGVCERGGLEKYEQCVRVYVGMGLGGTGAAIVRPLSTRPGNRAAYEVPATNVYPPDLASRSGA